MIVNIKNQYELEAPEGISTEYSERLEHEKNDSSHYVYCHYGKICKGISGLWIHQRFCTVSEVPELRELFKKEIIINGEYSNDKNFEEAVFTPQTKLSTLGLKLPKTTESWNPANQFFKSTLMSTNKSHT